MTTTIPAPAATSLDQQSIVLKSYKPIIFDIDSSIIFDVDLDEDYLSPFLPYIGFLSVTRHWRYNLDLELWLLPEGMEEAELLGYEFYKTNAVLNGERLYVSHDHVAEFIQAQDLMDSIVVNQHINPDEYSGSKTVNHTAPFELQKWSKTSFFITFRDKTASDVVSQYPVDLIRAAKISHLNGRGFLSKALSPHKILNRSIEDLDHSLLPCCLDVQPKSPARVLIFSSKEPFFQRNGIETTMPIAKLWNIVKSLRECSWECDCDYFEVFGSLNIIYLLSRYFNCIPVSSLACGFDSKLDLTENWEQDFLPVADVVISEEVQAEVERISHGWKRRAEPAVYHVTHRYRTDKPLETCFKSDRPLQELKENLYFLIGIAAIMFEDNLCGPLQHEELLSESICFLLQQYYGFEVCPYQHSAVELDLYYLCEFDEELQRTDSEWDLELRQKYGRAGVIDCIGMFMRGEIEVGIGEDCQLKVKSNHPKTALSDPLTPTSNGDDFKAIQDYQSRSSGDPIAWDKDDATYLNHGVESLPVTQEMTQENQQPSTDLYQSLYRAADQYGGFEAGFNLLNLGNGYSVTTTDQSLNIFKDDGLITHVVAVNPGPFNGDLQEPLQIEDKTTLEQREELQAELHNLEQPENITEQIQELDDTQGTKTPSVPIIKATQNIFWITEEGRYLNSKMTCVKTNKTHAQVKQDVYYLLSEAGEIINREWGKGIDETQPENEGICHLLVKYYGYELCEFDDLAIEIDTAWVGEVEDPDIPARDKNWLKWLDITHFRFGLYSDLTSIIRGDIDVSRMPQYPWSDVHQSVTGWDCGDYIIEAPFCQFNSAEDAKQYGRQCLGLYSAEGYDSVAILKTSNPDSSPILSKKDLILLEHPSPGQPVDYSERNSWAIRASDSTTLFIPSNCKRLYAEAIPLLG